MVVSQTSEYALRACVVLARDPAGWMTNEQIAGASRVPSGYLAKILQWLTRAGIVVSQRGIGGGFTLARGAADISILDVINAVDPVARITRCPLDLPEHRDGLCPLHKALDAAIATVQEAFAGRSLEDLVAAAGHEGCHGGECDALGRQVCQTTASAAGVQRSPRRARLPAL